MGVQAAAEGFVRGAGRLAGALLVIVAIGQVAILLSRKLGFATVAAQEALTALAVPVVLLAVPWTLLLERHVAVDALAIPSARRVGLTLALIIGLVLLWLSVPYAWASFLAGEGSYEVSGFGLRWVAKAALPLLAALLALQAGVALVRR